MPKLLLTSIFFISLSLQATEVRTYKKTNSSQAQVTIKTEETESIQAASYVDGHENNKFINDMLNDKNSILYKLKSAIEIENCQKNSTPEKPFIAGCGQVTLTSEVRTSFGRDGWMSGGGSYTFFVGFTNDGSGKYFDVSHMVVISEIAEAEANSDGKYLGVIIKSLNLVKIKRIDENTP